MRKVRVVLYAEGPGETGGKARSIPPPRKTLPEEALGPGHILLRRTLLEDPEAGRIEVQFEAPLRVRGRIARGSQLLHRQTLRQLLTYFDPPPDLAVVLVDQDADNGRKRTLEEYVADLPSMPIIGVAIQEFESWLIADHSCVANIFDTEIQQPKNPEKMRRRAAKELLATWIARSSTKLEGDEIRREIASQCDLSTLAKICRAYGTFRKALVARI